MHKKIITVSVISELTTDQRVIRICSTLQEMGFDVRLIGRELKGSLSLGSYNFQARRIKCFFRKGFMQFAEFNTKLFFQLLFSKTHHFLANDLDTLVPTYIASKLRGKKIFYDTHEYYTGVPELKNSPVKKRVWKFFENWIFPKLEIVYTVNDSIKNLYHNEYGNDISVIRNVPVTEKIAPQALPPNWKNKIILLMQGVGIHVNRGGMGLLEMMKFLPDKYHLVYIGGGNIWNLIIQKRKEWGLENKVEMIYKMAPQELKRYTPLAHLGFSLDGSDDINFLYNLPNKIFDYIHAGVPVVATAIPEVKNIIEQFNCGICVQFRNSSELAKHVAGLIENTEVYEELRKNTITAAKELCWENEKTKLISIYQKYL